MQCPGCNTPVGPDGLCAACSSARVERPTLLSGMRQGLGTFCPTCGARNVAAWQSCFFCGGANPAARRRREWLAVLLAALLALMAAAWVLEPQPAAPPVPVVRAYTEVVPIPVQTTSIVVHSSTGPNGMQSTEVIQSGGSTVIFHASEGRVMSETVPGPLMNDLAPAPMPTSEAINIGRPLVP